MKKHPINTIKKPLYKNILIIITFILLVYFPIFLNLTYLPIRLWDESRVALNSIAMFKNHHFLVTFCDGSPDMWNTKPPFLIWLQALCINFFGINELSIRLPSAIAGIFTCLIIFHFSTRSFGNVLYGFFSILILITSSGYISYDHSTRTGDYDSMLVLWTTLYAISFYKFIEAKSERQKRKYLFIFFIALLFAVLTKSIAGLFLLPAFIIYSIVTKVLFSILKKPYFYGFLALFIVLIFGYYYSRELLNPGYLRAVYNNELGGRYFKVIEEHEHNYWYYLWQLKNLRFSYWFWLLPSSFLLSLFLKSKTHKRIFLFLSLIIICYLLIVSTAATTLKWYDLPLYPFMAVFISLGAFQLFDFINRIGSRKRPIQIIAVIVIISALINPYYKIVKKVSSKADINIYDYSYFLRQCKQNDISLNGYKLYIPGDIAHIKFYILQYEENHQRLQIIRNQKDINQNDTFLFHQNNLPQLANKYNLIVLEDYGKIQLCKIDSIKLFIFL